MLDYLAVFMNLCITTPFVRCSGLAAGFSLSARFLRAGAVFTDPDPLQVNSSAEAMTHTSTRDRHQIY